MTSAASGFSRTDRDGQTLTLARVFLARFFENEITRGTDDLKATFFWLLSFLAVPGFLMPVTMAFSWQLLALVKGTEALRLATRGDKAFYLGFAMIASAGLSAITWDSILPDRRDALILGALPVRARTVVLAKLAALAAYVALVAAAMHALASLSFGFLLASGNTFGFALRGVLAHFLVSFAGSVFVFLGVAGVQGLALAGLGPRLFARVSPALQMCLVSAIVAGLLALPTIDTSVVATLRGSGQAVRPWILTTPPLWFLGLYEWVLGTSDPTLLGLARTAALALGASAGLTMVMYPVAYRRVMSSVVLGGASVHQTGRSSAVANLLTMATGRNAHLRATSQFFLATLGRVPRHRFILAMAVGLAAAWGLPTWVSRLPNPPLTPRLDLLSLPLATMIFLLLGLRIAAALPADLNGSWMFDVCTPSRRHVRLALGRTMFALAVLPVVALCALVFWQLWGPRVAITHTMVSLAMARLIIQGLLWRFGGMPCARPWNPESIKLRSRWPAYAGAFLVVTGGLPPLELFLFTRPLAAAGFVVTLLLVTALVRHVASTERPLPTEAVDALLPGEILSLN